MIKKEELIKIGHFAKPHGVKGEISLVTTYDVFEESDNPYLICEMDGIPVPFFVEEYRYKSDTVILVKMENLDSEEAVRRFVNLDVYYPADAIGLNPNDVLTWESIVGYTVSGEKEGMLGEVTGIDESTLNVLLRIDHKGKELLIPAADELILSADHVQKHLTVSIPDGLLDL